MTQEARTINDYEAYERDMVVAARVVYAAKREGLEADPARSRVDLLSVMQPGDELRVEDIELQQAKLNVGVRSIVRSCVLLDTIERGGIKGKFAKVELGLTRIFEHSYLKNAFEEGGIIEAVRRPFPPVSPK